MAEDVITTTESLEEWKPQLEEWLVMITLRKWGDASSPLLPDTEKDLALLKIRGNEELETWESAFLDGLAPSEYVLERTSHRTCISKA